MKYNRLIMVFLFLAQMSFVTAHGIGESFKDISDFSLVRFIFGGLGESVRVFDGAIFDEVAGFIIYFIFFSILVIIFNLFLKKTQQPLLFKYKVFISIFITVIISHTKIIFFVVYLISKITKSTGVLRGIFSTIISYALLILIVYFLERKIKRKMM